MMTQENNYSGPLSGLHVIDFGHYYAGPMVGMNLADQGAKVIRIAKPGEAELPEQQYRLLNRNKNILTLDLKTAEGKQQALSLIEKADVLVENFRPGVMKRLGLDYASVKDKNPGLVYLSLPGFASTDKERAHLQAWEGLLGAASSVFTQTHYARQRLGFPPVYSAAPQCSAHGSMQGTTAVMAALLARETHGLGTVIEVPLVDAHRVDELHQGFDNVMPSAHDLPNGLKPFVFSADDTETAQLDKLKKGMAALPFPGKPFMGGIYTCKDNAKALLLCYDHKTFIGRLFKGLGIELQVQQEGFVNEGLYAEGSRHNNVSNLAGLSSERVERLCQLITEAFKTKTGTQWEAILSNNIPFSIIRTREEWLALEPMLASGVFTQMDNGVSQLTVPGRVAAVSGPNDRLMANHFSEAKTITVTEAAALFQSHRQQPVVSNKKTVPMQKGDLLKGLKILDLSNVLAGPISTYNLAKYGAEVIKADSSQPSSTMNYHYWLPSFISLFQGKRSILTDVKTASGQDVLRRLIGWADVVVHNILDETAKRLGITPEQLRAINPNVVSCQISAYGGAYRGAWEACPGYDWNAQSISGLMTQYGSEDMPCLHGFSAPADEMGAHILAFTSLLTAYQQRRTGWAGEGRTSLVQAANYFQLPWMIAENGRSDWGEARGQLALGESWWQRLYACSDGWLYVGVSDDRASSLAQSVLSNERLSGLAEKHQTDDEHQKALEASFAKQSCDYWQAVLDAADIACHPVVFGQEKRDPSAIRRVDNQSAHETAKGAVEILCWEDHPCGKAVSLRAPDQVRIGENHSYLRQTPAPYLGQNTREILSELGFSQSEVTELVRRNVCREYLAELGSKGGYFGKPA